MARTGVRFADTLKSKVVSRTNPGQGGGGHGEERIVESGEYEVLVILLDKVKVVGCYRAPMNESSQVRQITKSQQQQLQPKGPRAWTITGTPFQSQHLGLKDLYSKMGGKRRGKKLRW